MSFKYIIFNVFAVFTTGVSAKTIINQNQDQRSYDKGSVCKQPCLKNLLNSGNSKNINKCPPVAEANNYDLDQHLGYWYIVETSLNLPNCAFVVHTGPQKYYDAFNSDSSDIDGMITVYYYNRTIDSVISQFAGRISKLTYSGSSYGIMFTSGGMTDVIVVEADYDSNNGYVVMLTCTTQPNGVFKVNVNILSRKSSLESDRIKRFHGLLLYYGLNDVESRIKVNDQNNCLPNRKSTNKN